MNDYLCKFFACPKNYYQLYNIKVGKKFGNNNIYNFHFKDL